MLLERSLGSGPCLFFAQDELLVVSSRTLVLFPAQQGGNDAVQFATSSFEEAIGGRLDPNWASRSPTSSRSFIISATMSLK